MILPILSVADLRLHYPVRVGGIVRSQYQYLKAVDGVSFEVWPGDSVGVVGESGCGKSSLARASLLLSQPTSGQVKWDNEDVTQMDKKMIRPRRKDFQIVFQDPSSSLNPRMTIGDIIAEPLRSFFPELSKLEIQQQVQDMLPRVGLLPNMLSRYPHEFSGGQCQRISIARAVISKPKLLVLDEPVSALDVSVQAQVVNLLRELQSEFGLSYLFISHDLSIVRYISDRIIVLYLGKVVETGSREQLFGDPRHPYTRALIQAVPVADPQLRMRKTRYHTNGELPSPLDPPPGCAFSSRCAFASDHCRVEAPETEEIESGHTIACHHWLEIETNQR